MPTLSSFFNAVKPVLIAGAATNASGRNEIRTVVGELCDQLDRALMLADSYLAGAHYSRDNIELESCLANIDGKLMSSFSEHHVCDALCALADKFSQLFDPTRYSVSLSNYFEIPELISHLRNRERAVLDDLDEMTTQFRDLAGRLRISSLDEIDTIRQEIFAAIGEQRAELAKHRKKIKAKRRLIVDKI
jgi:hypothetical protein